MSTFNLLKRLDPHRMPDGEWYDDTRTEGEFGMWLIWPDGTAAYRSSGGFWEKSEVGPQQLRVAPFRRLTDAEARARWSALIAKV